MMTMNENRNLISMRQRRLLEELNREILIKRTRRQAARKRMARILTAGLAIIALLVLVFCAEIKAANDARAEVLRERHYILDYYAQRTPNTGLEASDPLMVEPIPETVQAVEAPPAAIEIKDAAPAEAVPAERWESLGIWTLTAYCPLECCNGKGRAWTTASGAPMEAGKTVAVGGLPFGTELMINGQVYVVQDRGVKGKHADILFPDHDSALAFGVKKAEVFIKR